METALSEGEKKILTYFVIFAIIMAGISAFSNLYNTDQISKLQKENYQLSRRYIFLAQDKFVNLTKWDCNKFEIFVRLNETKACLRPLNQLNDTMLDSIHNACGQDIVIKCG